MLEPGQCRVTKMIKGLEHLWFKKRFGELAHHLGEEKAQGVLSI